MISRSAVVLVALLGASLANPALAGDIQGFWKHEKQPGWIEIRVADGVGTGTVVRNDVYPERVGRKILKDLVADGTGGDAWQGQVYAERRGEYRDVKVILLQADQLHMKVKMGFLSRTLKWVRVDGVTAAEPQ